MLRKVSLVFFHFCVCFTYGTSPDHKRLRSWNMPRIRGSIGGESVESTNDRSPVESSWPHVTGKLFPSEIWNTWMESCRDACTTYETLSVSVSKDSLTGQDIMGDRVCLRPRKDWGVFLPGLATFSPRLQQIARRQIETDVHHLVVFGSTESPSGLPSLVSGPNWYSMSEQTIWGTIFLKNEPAIARTKTATVNSVDMARSDLPEGFFRQYRIAPDNIVVKYQADLATEAKPVHTLMLDAWMLSYLELEEVTPRFYWLSPQFPLPKERLEGSAKLNFSNKDWDEEFYRRCPEHSNRPFIATVRFLIMEQVGKSIHKITHEVKNNRFALGNALNLGANMLESLRKIHDKGVVHGDIHSGNICTEYNAVLSADMKMMFIDFGRAFFHDETQHMQIRDPFSFRDPLHSHWDIEGWQAGKRDDLFKLFLVMATMVNGKDYYVFVQSLSARKMYKWKANDNIFIIPTFNVFDPTSAEFDRGSPEASAAFAAQVQERIELLLAQVRALDTIYTPINYEGIIRELRHIYKAISKKTTINPF